jgi:hypothetical protein
MTDATFLALGLCTPIPWESKTDPQGVGLDNAEER